MISSISESYNAKSFVDKSTHYNTKKIWKLIKTIINYVNNKNNGYAVVSSVSHADLLITSSNHFLRSIPYSVLPDS